MRLIFTIVADKNIFYVILCASNNFKKSLWTYSLLLFPFDFEI